MKLMREIQNVLAHSFPSARDVIVVAKDENGEVHCLRGSVSRVDAAKMLNDATKKLINRHLETN